MAALGLFSAAWLIIATTGSEGDIWLLVLPALLVAIPVRSTLQQIRVYGATRYALTNRRVLFFRIEGDETRVKAHPHSAICAPDVINTFPPSVSFLRYGKDPKSTLGFEYIKNSEILVHHLEQREEW
ncbi:hypothetical protein [Sulfitobacter guttiformis]|nr:hypothetical protein [Sulfitobacter guttiformis]KIN73776.1 hypothetical protein Z949_2968 [Sulfitobacter guttiformis KCTC 32187]